MLAELVKTGKAARIKGFEFPKAIHLEADPWTAENDCMTPSLKLKRPQLQKKYQKDIDAMYQRLNATARER